MDEIILPIYHEYNYDKLPLGKLVLVDTPENRTLLKLFANGQLTLKPAAVGANLSKELIAISFVIDEGKEADNG